MRILAQCARDMRESVAKRCAFCRQVRSPSARMRQGTRPARGGQTYSDEEDSMGLSDLERQEAIAKSSVKSPDSFLNAPGAKHRNEPPGFLGGHV